MDVKSSLSRRARQIPLQDRMSKLISFEETATGKAVLRNRQGCNREGDPRNQRIWSRLGSNQKRQN